MEKLRKICVVVFASLSLFFALVAIRNHFFPSDVAKNIKTAAHWNANLETIARKNDNLIFFYVSGNEIISNKIKNLLENHYVFSVLDKEKNPADFAIFNHFLKSASKSEAPLTCAILTPTLQPIYLSSKIDKDQLEKILYATARKYVSNRHLLRERALRATETLKTFDVRFATAPLYQTIPCSVSHFAFGNVGDIPISIMTENARLHFNIYKTSANLFAQRDAINALKVLKQRYTQEKEKSARRLIARALADIAFAVDTKYLTELKAEADSITSSKKQEQNITDCALALSVLSRAHSVFGDDKYLLTATKIFKTIKSAVFNKRTIPAILQMGTDENDVSAINSLACAHGMSMMANALCDFSEATSNNDVLYVAMAIINKLDADYLHNGIWTLNSSNAPSAKFARLSILDDSHIPSHVGEAYQAVMRIKKGLNLRTISPAEAYIARIETLFIPAFSETRASIKLAKFM